MNESVASLFEKPIDFQQLNQLMNKYGLNVDLAFDDCIYAARQFGRMKHELKQYPIEPLQNQALRCDFDRNFWTWLAFLTRIIEYKFDVPLVSKLGDKAIRYDDETASELLRFHSIVRKVDYYRSHDLCVPNSAISGKLVEHLQKSESATK